MSDSSPAIRIRSFLQIAPYLASRGVSAIEFFDRLGISPNLFQDPDGWLPRAQCFRAANLMASLARDPFAGAQVGRSIGLAELGAWGEAVLAAPDVGHACVAAAANARMLHRGSDVRFVSGRKRAHIFFRFEGRCEVDPQQFIFGSLAVLRKVPLLAGEPAAIRVRLSARPMRGSEALEECLGPRIETGCSHDAIEIDRHLLELPLARSGRSPDKAEEALAATIATAQYLSLALASGRVTVRLVAARLGLSVRTLQRRLKYCGVDFEDLLDDTRRSEAVRLLTDSDHSMIEVALRLGYSDPSHFTRAFRRWTGVPPSHFAANPPSAGDEPLAM